MKKRFRFPVFAIVLIALSCGKADGPPAASESNIEIYAFGPCTALPEDNPDMRLKKYDIDGNEVVNGWDLHFDEGNNDYGSDNCMDTDSEGNVYVAYTSLVEGTGNDWRIRKFTPSGAEAAGWNKRVGTEGSGRGGFPKWLLVDSADDVYVIGITSFGGTDNEWQIKKYHSDGAEISEGWDKVVGFPATSDYPIAAALGPDRSLYVLGLINGSYLVKKYSPSGTEDAANTPAITADLHPSAIAVDSTGKLYLGGFRYVDAMTRDDWFIKKYSATGIEITEGWDKTVDGEGLDDILDCFLLDREDSLYVAGSLHPATAEYSQERIVKYLPDGTMSWELTLDEGVFSRINSIAIGPDGDAYFLGYFNGGGEAPNWDWRILRLSRDGIPDLSDWNLSFDANVGQQTGLSIVAVF